MAAVTICSDFGAQKNKVWHCFHCFPIYFPWSDGTSAMIFVFWMLSFKPTFSLSAFTFIKRLFSSSSLSAIYTALIFCVYVFPPFLLISLGSCSRLSVEFTVNKFWNLSVLSFSFFCMYFFFWILFSFLVIMNYAAMNIMHRFLIDTYFQLFCI